MDDWTLEEPTVTDFFDVEIKMAGDELVRRGSLSEEDLYRFIDSSDLPDRALQELIR